MASYWSVVEPYWDNCPTDDPDTYLAYYKDMPQVARDLLTSHWVVSEVCNGGFHQLFTNRTGVLVPEAIKGFRTLGLVALAEASIEAASFFGDEYPREQMQRIEALEMFATQSADADGWNPFERLDDHFYAALDLDAEADAFTSAADAYAESA